MPVSVVDVIHSSTFCAYSYKRTQFLSQLTLLEVFSFSLGCKLGIDTNIHMVFLNLMIALASTEGTCSGISKTLGMREGQAPSWHPLTVIPGLCLKPLCVFCCVYFRKVIQPIFFRCSAVRGCVPFTSSAVILLQISGVLQIPNTCEVPFGHSLIILEGSNVYLWTSDRRSKTKSLPLHYPPSRKWEVTNSDSSLFLSMVWKLICLVSSGEM